MTETSAASVNTKAGAPPTLDLLRHGHIAGHSCLRGWQDDPLDALGWQQMHAALGDDRDWQRIISSPLQRCRAFADALAAGAATPTELDPRWRELHFGDWEGRSIASIQSGQPDQPGQALALQRFWADPERHPPPGGESLTTFDQRVGAAWDELCAELMSTLQGGQRALLVTHGGVIRLLLCRVLGMPASHQFRFEVPHACRLRIVLDAEQPRLALGTPYPARETAR